MCNHYSCLLIFFVVIIFSGCSKQVHPDYDVAIIGGGLAGMSAAYELKDLNVVLLEKENRLGGRVWTKYWNDTPYELGALFGYSSTMLPSGIPKQPMIDEPDNIGFSSGGKTYLGRNVSEAVSKFTQDQTVVSKIEQASAERSGTGNISLNDFPEDIRKILTAFFNLIHPGDPSEYMPGRLSDAFIRFNTSHYSGGNSDLITAFSEHANPKIMTGAEVTSVIDDGSKVQIIIKSDNNEKTIYARKAIVATPATVADKIIRNISPESKEFLSNVKYGEGIVVVLGIKKPDLLPFSYIVTAENSFNSVFQSRIKGDIRILTVYYVSNQAKKLTGKNINEIITLTKTELNSMGIGKIKDSDILFSDGHRWNDLGTIISTETYSGYNQAWLKTSENVFLAGDYTFLDKRYMMPYGMLAAAQSGRFAAESVKKQLRSSK